jgi:2-polyprenyl-3-methyl-5-hydroxy-6-metoxy-1,4-benzoquinol methylase
MFMAEKEILSPDKERERYLQHINHIDNQGYVDMLTGFLNRAVYPFQAPGGSALDFGCGPGPVLSHLMDKMSYQTDIYDPYFAPGKDFPGQPYHLITCTEVVEHLKKPMKELTFISSLLAPGGILAIMTLFHPIKRDNDEQAEALFQKWWYRRDKTHICFFRPETFQYIANVLGLEIIFADDKNSITLRKSK